MRVGGRVLTGGAEPDRSLETAVDARTWRHLTLEGTERWPDGTVDRVCVESLLPPEWLARYGGAAVGSTVPLPLDLNEMGLPEGLTATVVANQPCPPIEASPGRVVLTTVNHLNPRVVELTLAAPDGTRETVRPTAFHKFYSETRGRWLSAEDLQPDERLRGLAGPLQVISRSPMPGLHRVYNMTVEGEHVYHVSTLGVLAHNMQCAQTGAPRGPAIPGDADFVGPIRGRGGRAGWRNPPHRDGAHLFERVNTKRRPAMSHLDQPDTPRFYGNGSPENAGAAHTRLHDATREAGIALKRGDVKNAHLSDIELLDLYRDAYARPELQTIRGSLRTPDGSVNLGNNLTPAEAWEALMRWSAAQGLLRSG